MFCCILRLFSICPCQFFSALEPFYIHAAVLSSCDHAASPFLSLMEESFHTLRSFCFYHRSFGIHLSPFCLFRHFVIFHAPLEWRHLLLLFVRFIEHMIDFPPTYVNTPSIQQLCFSIIVRTAHLNFKPFQKHINERTETDTFSAGERREWQVEDLSELRWNMCSYSERRQCKQI